MAPMCVPDPAMFRAFDAGPARVIPTALFEELGALLKRRRPPAGRLRWRQVLERIRLCQEGIDPEALAIGLLLKHPDWSVAQIAAAVGVHRGTLHRWPTFRVLQAKVLAAARADFQADLPRGRKQAADDGAGAAGDLEAWEAEPADDAD
jgi:hypothetical protein